MKKCPYCAEEIQDEAAVCRFCGRVISSPPVYNPQSGRKTQPNWTVIGVIIVVASIIVSISVCCVFPTLLAAFSPSNGSVFQESAISTDRYNVEIISTTSPRPTSRPTATPEPLSMADIEYNYEKLTDVQWEEYSKSLKGKRILWIGTVTEVDEDGTVFFDVGEELFHRVYINDLPIEEAKALNKGQVIEVEATIEKVSTFLGLSVWLTNPKIIAVK